jgi:hypothetical protein
MGELDDCVSDIRVNLQCGMGRRFCKEPLGISYNGLQLHFSL